MPTTPLSKPAAHALLHLTVFVWGFTGIFGKAITAPALSLVWYRLALVVPMMAALAAARGRSLALPWAKSLPLWGVGVLVGGHWVLFYGCIKVAGIGVAVLCLSAITLFTALIEPLVFRRRFRPSELLFGLAVAAAVSLLVRLEGHSSPLGLAMGLGSALFSAAFGTLNGRVAARGGIHGELVTLHEMGAALAVTSLTFCVWPGDFVLPTALTARDAALLVALAIGCTVVPWLWTMRILRTLTPFTVALAVNLEPVYSLALAYVLFPESERLGWRFYAGAAAIVAAVLLHGWRQRAPASPARDASVADRESTERRSAAAGAPARAAQRATSSLP